MIKRRPTVRDGELHIYWGREERHEEPGVIYHSGDGTSRRDRALLHYVLGSKRPTGCPDEAWQPSLFDDLESRGYDLTTLRFYIRKKNNEEKANGGG